MGGHKFGQLDEHQLQPFEALGGLRAVDKAVVVVVGGQVGLKHVVHQVQGVHGLQGAVLAAAPNLADVGFGGVEEYPRLERVRPQHLHLHDELPAVVVLAAHIHNAVLEERQLGHQLGRQVFERHNLLAFRQRQQGVEQALEQVRVLAKHLFERQVVFGVEVAHGGGG